VQKRLIRVGFVMALAMGTFGLGAAPASAAPVQKCAKVTGTITMSPGLSATSTSNQKVIIKGTEKSCKPAAKTKGSGTFKSVLVLKKANCTVLAKGNITFKGTATTKWKSGKTTTYSVTYHDGSGSLNKISTITMTGKATKGLFVGKKFTAGFKININGANSGACTTTPFKKAPWKQTKAWTLS
jgi:hypothetical protein